MFTSYSTLGTGQSGGTLNHALPELTFRWTTTTEVIFKSPAISEIGFIDWFHRVSAYFNVSDRTERLRDWLQWLPYNFYFAFVLASFLESVNGFVRILSSEVVWIRLRNSDCKLLHKPPHYLLRILRQSDDSAATRRGWNLKQIPENLPAVTNVT